MSSESWSRSSSSRTRYDDRKRRDRQYDDYDDRRRPPDRERRRGSSERDRYRSHDDDRDRDSRREKSSRRHHRSRSRSRSSSYDRYESSRRRKSHRDRSRSTEKKAFKSHSSEITNIKILRASRSRSKSQNRTVDENMERKNSYFDSFRTTNVDNSSIIGNIDESDFDREKIHKEMQERLSLHLAREGKVYPPPKPQASHPIFANDGSFLETFKKMQEQQKQQIHDHKTEPTTTAVPAAQQQYQKPMFSKRRGGKILKTGIVQKPKITDETVTEETPNDAWSLYLQEVKKYKNVSCDADSKTRPLVK